MNTLTVTELISKLRDAFATFLGVEPSSIDPNRTVKELGMDSLTAIELAVKIEEKLGVSLFLDDFTGEETISGLAAAYLRENAA
ncbi:MAG TPA: acyl carrier protein [Candidatus Dormibacteraeota bacterium]|jgi:acyl carrier protein|nr:acyl carrier protein [Candidatus Dormibacteraeota bacterium]